MMATERGAGKAAAAVPAPKADRLVPLLILLVTGALLGLSTTLAKLAVGVGLAALPFLLWSVLGSGLVLLAVAAARGNLPRLDRRTLEYFVLAALVSVAAPNLVFFSAIPHVGAGFVALTIAIPPLLTYVGAVLLRLERLKAGRAAGVVLALAGAAAIAIPKFNAPDTAASWVALTLLGPVFLAMGNLYRTLRWPPGARPDALAPGMLLAAAALLLGFAPLAGLPLAVPLDRWEPPALVLAQTAVFALQYLLFFVLQKRGGPVYLSLLGSVGAVVAVPVAVLLLGEAPPTGLALGATLIAAGIAVLTLTPSEKP